jgi:predicted RNA-binding Zn-ribbon protein involved in translation (DUF1610 family)
VVSVVFMSLQVSMFCPVCGKETIHRLVDAYSFKLVYECEICGHRVYKNISSIEKW